VAVDETEIAVAVLVEHEVLAEQTNRLQRLVVEFRLARDGLPVAAQQIAHRLAGLDLGQKLVLVGAEHGCSPDVSARTAME
jgi:hypothetical protein